MSYDSSTAPTKSTRKLVWLFTTTIFLSACLLFFVQPLFAKIVLPRLGGSPAVWTTAMLFFQSVLIAGYIYAHLLTKYVSPRIQVGLHLLLWISALFFIPLTIPEDWRIDPQGSIATQTLWVFALGVGLPFAFLSANAPLIQSWYGSSGGPNAEDPYFLYGASNLGSLGALLAFPLIAEPLWGARDIGNGWAIGFVALGLFLAVCGFSTSGLRKPLRAIEGTQTETTEPPTTKDYLWWLVLAFIPSSLMLSVTTHISVDLGSFPLLWVIPLALYLLTFVLTFNDRLQISEETFSAITLVSVVVMAFTSLSGSLKQIAVPILLLCFFILSVRSHKALYDKRPSKHYLTLFYVVMSVGGALGGLFNSLAAPIFFSGLYELKATLVAATLLFFVSSSRINAAPVNYKLNAAILVGFVAYYYYFFLISDSESHLSFWNMLQSVFIIALLIFRGNPFGAAFTTTAFLITTTLMSSSLISFQDRSFFGIHKVQNVDNLRVYGNGSTIHGKQLITDMDAIRPTPLSYYYAGGSFGQILQSQKMQDFKEIGIIGLGTGSLACYAKPHQKWQFYEIDEAVVKIAKNPNLFTFMSRCAKDAPVHLGDARIVLQEQTDISYDLLMVDAFSSNAIPLHIITYEAIDLYMSKLKKDGILFLHISNRYFDLSQPIARSAKALGLKAKIQRHKKNKSVDPNDYHDSSVAVIIARNEETLEQFNDNGDWLALESDGKAIWTDDFANVLSALRPLR